SPDSLATLPAGFESTEGQALLGELPDEGSSTALVLFTRDDGQITDDLPGLAEVMVGVAETYDTGEAEPAAPVDAAETEGSESGPPAGATEGEGGESGPPAGATEGEEAGPPPGVDTGADAGAEGAGGPPPGVTEGGIPVIPS